MALDDLPGRCDVAVIGAGVAGSVVALQLARAGVDVVVLDAADALAARGLDQVELGVLEHPHRTVAALGPEHAQALFRWTDRGKALLSDEGLLDPSGVLWAATDPREPEALAASCQALTEQGRAAELWDAPRVNAETGGAEFGPGLWLPDDSRLVRGALATLRHRAQTAGAHFAWSSRATISDDGQSAGVGVNAGTQRIEAELVVVAAGAGSGTAERQLAERITPVREVVLRTAPTAMRSVRVARAGQGWTAWAQDPDGSVLLSGARWASPHLEVGEIDTCVLHPKVQSRLEAFATRFLLGGAPAQIVERWAYVFGQTPDGLPLIGPLPGDPRRVVCTGFGACSTALAAAAACAVAEGLVGESREVPWMLSARRMVRWRAS